MQPKTAEECERFYKNSIGPYNWKQFRKMVYDYPAFAERKINDPDLSIKADLISTGLLDNATVSLPWPHGRIVALTRASGRDQDPQRGAEGVA